MQEATAVDTGSELVTFVDDINELGKQAIEDAKLSPQEREAKRVAAHLAELIGDDGLPKFITVDYVQSKIKDCACLRAPDTSLVICYITMMSGATVVGKANFSDLDNFDQAKGDEQAYNDALRQIVDMEIYALANLRHFLAPAV